VTTEQLNRSLDHSTDRSPDDSLDDQRRYIDRIDGTIVALLAERMRIALTVGRLKRARDQPIRSELREADVIARVRDTAPMPLSPASAERIFRAIIDETAACQARAAATAGDEHGH
jgi:chorismate mutase